MCGARLIARPANGRRSMQCSPDPRDDPRDGPAREHRGHVRVVADPMEALVIEAVMLAIEGGKLARLLAGRHGDRIASLRTELASVETKLETLAAMLATDELADVEWRALREPLTGRRKDLIARIESALEHGQLAAIPDPLRDAWPRMDFAQRRSAIQAVVDKVIVNRTRHGVPRFDRGRIEVLWR